VQLSAAQTQQITGKKLHAFLIHVSFSTSASAALFRNAFAFSSRGRGLFTRFLASVVLVHVRGNKEPDEQGKHAQDVKEIDFSPYQRRPTTVVQNVGRLGHHCHKLKQLQFSDVGPHRLGHLVQRTDAFAVGVDGFESGSEIVSVHDEMNKPIGHDGEVDIGCPKNICVDPVHHEDANVMVQMEERKLTVFLVKYKEERIKQIQPFGQIKEIQKERHLRIYRSWIERVAHRCVIQLDCSTNCLNDKVPAANYLGEVVQRDQRFEKIVFLEIAHDQIPKEDY
jgi:hypothetical protein